MKIFWLPLSCLGFTFVSGGAQRGHAVLSETHRNNSDNKFGIMTLLTAPSCDLDGGLGHFEAASKLTGKWGWIRQYIKADPEETPQHVRTLAMRRALKLRPVFCLNDLGGACSNARPSGASSRRPIPMAAMRELPRISPIIEEDDSLRCVE